MFGGGVGLLIAGCFALFGEENSFVGSILFSFLGVSLILFASYFCHPNEIFHYFITPKAVYYTQQGKVSDNFYLVIYMLGRLLVLVRLVAVAVIGHFALVGAGGAFMAMGMTKMCAKVSHLGAYFYEGPIEMRVYSKGYMFDTISEPFSIKYHLEIYCNLENYEKITSDIKSYLPNHTEVNLSSQRDFLK
ncbi:hypothetical protein [Plesiomonas shigelloides]|uniref:hypothetical protein n=1 Tax=Plesiomonas shigelloides TaxID=703 RepID=UPI0022452D3C|nr:hypothetical protein [Plesiomonas shigelloides]MCX2499144.1 hypothetical protein [Plesiomonas shigelloides]